MRERKLNVRFEKWTAAFEGTVLKISRNKTKKSFINSKK